MKMALLFFGLTVISACTGSERDMSDKGITPPAADNATVDFTVMDSVEIIEYPAPNDQKEYTFVRSADTLLLRLLLTDLNGGAQQLTPCTHYRKLYLFENGEVFKTVYVSDSCAYLAYSVNGNQQFKTLSPELMKEIDARLRLKNPANR